MIMFRFSLSGKHHYQCSKYHFGFIMLHTKIIPRSSRYVLYQLNALHYQFDVVYDR